jgi:hypothetical protein
VTKEPRNESIFRWIHLIFSIPILGYIYSPFDKIPGYAPPTPVYLRSCYGAFGIMGVEGPCPSATYLEKVSLVTLHAPSTGTCKHLHISKSQA